MNLEKPWEAPDKKEPESLVSQLWAVRKKVRESADPDYKNKYRKS